MPDENSHLQQADHNRQFFDTLDKDRFGDWAATTIFYTALHYVDAYLAHKGYEPGNHDDRQTQIKAYVELKRITTPYMRLKNASVRARYYGDKPAAAELQALVDNPLKCIKEWIEDLLKK